jgi:hypothetical protein
MPAVYASTLIPASATRVWAVLRDFNALPSWHPSITQSRIEGFTQADRVGCIRAFRLVDGGSIREKLLALSDFDYSLTYSILESPMAVSNYTATLKILPVTETNATFVEWSAEFMCPPDQEKVLTRQIEKDVFQKGLMALKQRFGG